MAVSDRSYLGVFEPGFDSWSRVLDNSTDDAVRLKNFANFAAEVVSYVGKGLDRTIAHDELLDRGVEHGFDLDQIETVINGAFEPPPGEQKTNGQDHAEQQQEYRGPEQQAEIILPKRATPYVQPATIAPRQWLHGGHYIRGAATATVAPGGTGKTTLTLFEAITMVAAGLSVWYISAEDPQEELDRRIAAHCVQHQINIKQLPGRLFVDDQTSWNFKIAKTMRPNVVAFDDKGLTAFEQAILLDRIDVVALDPFISFHAVAENDNGSIDAVVKRLKSIAQHTNCCIEICHHVRKPFSGQGSLTVDDARGGSAIINAVRSGRVINRMSELEAQQAKVTEDNRHFYIRVDRGKRNMAPPDKATWFRLINVPLDNGDQVQALEPWKFPALFDGITVEDTDWIRDLLHERPYRCDSRSQDWLGIPIAERLHLDCNEKADCMRINKLIGVWLKNGVFKKMEMKDATRRPRQFYVAVETPEPELPLNIVRRLFDEDEVD